MRGSIRKRGSTYSYWLDIGSDPVTGKRRQRTKGGFRTKRECQAALNEAISALRSGTLVQPSRRTVASFVVAAQQVRDERGNEQSLRNTHRDHSDDECPMLLPEGGHAKEHRASGR